MPMTTLRRSVLILVVSFLALAGLYAYSLKCGPDWLKDISLNVGTEILGIVLTVLLIDVVIRKKEQVERERVVNVAFAQLRVALQQHIVILLNMYKASAEHAPHPLPDRLETLFGPDYFVQIAFLDLSKPAPVASVKPLQWFDYLHIEMEQFKSALTRTLEKYAVFLNPATVELLEELLASSLISVLTQLKSIPHLDQMKGIERSYNFFSGQGMPAIAQQHIDLVKRLAAEADRYLPKEKSIGVDTQYWRDDIAPKFGTARI